MNRSLRFRLLLGLLLSLGLLLVAVSLFVYLLQRALFIRDFDRRLHSALPRTFRQLRPERGEAMPQAGAEIDGVDAYWIRVRDSGNYLICYPPEKPPVSGGVTHRPGGPHFFNITFKDGEKGRAFLEYHSARKALPPPGIQKKKGSAEKPPVSVFVASRAEKLHGRLRASALIIGISALVCMLVVTLVVLLVVGRALEPLHILDRQIASLDPERLHQRLHVSSLPAEILPVVNQLNRLFERLDEAFQRERNFAHDAAHELRTPVAGIRSELEVTLARDRPDTEYVQALERCLGSVTALQDMIEKLLELARLEGRRIDVQSRSMDVRATMFRRWQTFSQQAQERGLVFENNVPSGLLCRADPVLFERVVDNLLGNAARYADRGCSITVEGEQGRECVVIRIVNPAEGLEKEDLPRMFDRFWRKDPARSGSGAGTYRSYGLGLTFVKRAVEYMGGSVHARLSEELTVELTLKNRR